MDLMPVKASTVAGSVDAVYYFILACSVLSFLLLMGGMTYFIIKYRRRTDHDKTPHITHNYFAEFLWSFIPFVLFMIIFYVGWKVYKVQRTFPTDALQIEVVGKKWAWQINYKEGFSLVNELYVPVNKAVIINLTSDDVLHSFYIPSFRVKQDAVPGKRSRLWFEATQTGEFHIFCTEYCGTQHSTMMGKVHVLEENEYEEWLQEASNVTDLTDVQKGEKLYKTQVCFTCHSLDGSKVLGPSFKGLWGRTQTLESGKTVVVDEAYIKESILNPLKEIVKGYPPSMPPYQGRITDIQIQQIIEYIKTIK